MSKGRVIIKYLLILAVAFNLCFAQKSPIKEGSLGATQLGSVIRITWKSESEAGLDRYEVYRSTSIESPFLVCIRNNIAPTGSGSTYTIDDNSDLLKAEARIYCYKVKAVYKDGSAVFSNPVVTNYGASSTAKRTWGSIKAMFR